MFCNKCGNKMDEGEMFCGKCGSPRKGDTNAGDTAGVASTSHMSGQGGRAAKAPEAAEPTPGKSRMRIAVIAGALAVAASLLLAVFVALPAARYKKATELFDEQRYTEAFATLQKLSSGYKDVPYLYPYYDAHASLSAGEYELAAMKFEGCGSYRDSEQMVLESRYQHAVSLLTPEGSVLARAMFLELGDYKDSASRGIDCDYFDAVRLLADKKYHEARLAFRKLGGFGDSEQMITECDYAEAADWLDDKRYGDARSAFLRLGSYKDSVEMLIECDYREAGDLLSGGSYKAAHDMLIALGGYKDSQELAERSKQVAYDDAVAMRGDKFYAKAASVFSWLGDYMDSPEQLNALSAYWYRSNSYRIATVNSTIYGLNADGTVIYAHYRSPEQIYSMWSDIVAISGGESDGFQRGHIVGLRADGTVVASGQNSQGQCDVEGWRDIVEIATTLELTVGLRSNGTVVMTGERRNFELAETLSGWRDITAIATTSLAGLPVVVGLKADKSVVVAAIYGFDVSAWSDIATVWAEDGRIYGVREDGTTFWSIEEHTGTMPQSQAGFRAAAPSVSLYGNGNLRFEAGQLMCVLNSGETISISDDPSMLSAILEARGIAEDSICKFIAISSNAALRADGTVVIIDAYSNDSTNLLEGWNLN